MKRLFNIVVFSVLSVGVMFSAPAQTPVPPPEPVYQMLSNDQLDQLLGPIALYPDPLIAQILPASTFPTEIVLADRFIGQGGGLDQIDQQPWDDSVKALARYPDVLKWMDENLDWTTELGQAFLNQQQDVMDSIQRLRVSAYNLGNLQSTAQQQVINDGGYIEIVPVNAQVIYVPVYQPSQVYYVAPVGGPFITFGVGFAIGPWLDCDLNWSQHNIIVWNRSHPRPPNWWHEPARRRNIGHVAVWRPNRSRTFVHHGDRGWSAPARPSVVVATVSHSISDSVAPRRTPAPVARPGNFANRPSVSATHPAPAPARHFQPANRSNHSEPNGAFIGIQNSRDTRAYSNRGRQSMQNETHPAPVSHSAPASHPAAPSGGRNVGNANGGGHNSNPRNGHGH